MKVDGLELLHVESGDFQKPALLKWTGLDTLKFRIKIRRSYGRKVYGPQSCPLSSLQTVNLYQHENHSKFKRRWSKRANRKFHWQICWICSRSFRYDRPIETDPDLMTISQSESVIEVPIRNIFRKLECKTTSNSAKIINPKWREFQNWMTVSRKIKIGQENWISK